MPKGTSFKDLTKAQVALATSYINSAARELFDNKTPFDLFVGENEKKLLALLDLSTIAPDEVFLKPALLKTKPNEPTSLPVKQSRYRAAQARVAFSFSKKLPSSGCRVQISAVSSLL